MAVTSATSSSGLDIEAIVTKLMAVEQKPLTSLVKKETSYQAIITGYGTLKSALSQFQTSVQALSSASKYQAVNATAADATIASATAGTTATAGTFSLEVTQLAQAQKLVAAGQASETAAIGAGVITIDFGTISGGALGAANGKYTGSTFTSSGTGLKTITIDSTNNTLDGIRDAINKAGIGITATIVNDGGTSPYRLALTNQSTGEATSMKISVADASGAGTGLSTLLNHDPGINAADGGQALTQTAAAQDAKLKVDGIPVSKASNTVSDVIPGVTLSLLKTNSGSATNITVARDTASVSTAVKSFVSAYNSIASTLKSAMAYDPKTKSSAVLNGESSVRNIQTQLRNVLSKAISGSGSGFATLMDIGVNFEKDGTLSIDDTKLQKALTTNFSGFSGLFAADGKITDSLISYSKATDKTKPGTYAVNITQLATQGSTVASGVAGLTIDNTNNSLTIKLDGVTSTISLTQKTYASATELAAEIQSKINGVSENVTAGSTVKVTASGGKLSMTSNRYGSVSNISITGGTGQNYLGLDSSATATAGLDVAGTINGQVAGGSGQLLTGATGDASEGLKITVAGGNLGARGTVSFAQGYAYQYDQLLTSILGSDGPITARTDGLNATIKTLTDSQEKVSSRLDQIEKNYRAQFTSLDVLLNSMNTTSTYLTQQLAAIASVSNSISSK